jgi:hypothetical protein
MPEIAGGIVGSEGVPSHRVQAVLEEDRAAEQMVPRKDDAVGGAVNDDVKRGELRQR